MRSSIVVTLFILILFFSVSVPYILPFGTVLFALLVRLIYYLNANQYYVEKYNYFFVYNSEFEGNSIARKFLVVYSIVGIILF